MAPVRTNMATLNTLFVAIHCIPNDIRSASGLESISTVRKSHTLSWGRADCSNSCHPQVGTMDSHQKHYPMKDIVLLMEKFSFCRSIVCKFRRRPDPVKLPLKKFRERDK